MSPDYQELTACLARVRSRWRRSAVLRGLGLAAGAAGLILAAALGVYLIARPTDVTLIVLAGGTVLASFGCFAVGAWHLGRVPNARRVARFVEERVPELEDRVATAVAFGERSGGGDAPVVERLVADAVARIRDVDVERIVSRDTINRAALVAGAGVGLLLVMSVASRTPAGRVLDAATYYAFPSRMDLDVQPGHANVRAGDSLRIRVHVRGGAAVVTPTLELGPVASGSSRTPVESGFSRTALATASSGRQDEFVVTLDGIHEPFTYRVSAGRLSSPAFTVRVLRPPHVKRIDLSYEYPPASGLKDRIEEDGGDIYAPAGTTVRMRVVTDKPVASGEMVMADGARRPMTASAPESLETTIRIAEDSSYRIALGDLEGLRNPGETEYFIRTLEDRPPDVRIIRPTGDQDVTPLQEVTIEARADDDYGIAQFDLVYSVRGSRERVAPLRHGASGLTAVGSHTLYLEDLDVQPGDFVTYFARARDVGRGRKSTEARSDIFFLEVKPYEEEFVAAQSQAGFGTNDLSLEELARAQKDIIVATWKLDRRALDGTSGQSQPDILQVARAQGELQERAREAASAVQFSAARGGLGAGRGVLRGSSPSTANPVFEALTAAVAAMGRAKTELQALKTASATPHEMEALNQILKAQAEIRRRQVSRSQQANASGGANRSERDLSTLFDRELRRQQETNYERPAATERKEDQARSDVLDRVRELARRQASVNQAQQELANKKEQMSAEEVKRQLERLTREQSDLRQQAEDLARALSQSSGQAQSGKDMRGVSEEMRRAATELRRSDPRQASESGQSALDKLKALENELRAGASAGTDPESKKLSDQLAQAQRVQEQMKDVQRRIEQLAEQIQQLGGQPGLRPNGGKDADSPDGKDGPQGRPDKLAKLQEELQTTIARARELIAQLGRSEGGGFGVAPEGQELSRSASGLEGYKQDFRRWDSLKKDINLALERFEVSLARKLAEKEGRERLNAGANHRVPEAYRPLVDKYYQSLARRR